MTDLRQRLESLSPEKRALVMRRLRERAGRDASSIPRVPRGTDLPLSFAQQRLWVLYELEGPGATYNMPFALDLRGPLDADALEKSFDAVVRRHEILRTSFHRDAAGLPVQRIHDEVPFALARVDLEKGSDAERMAEVERIALAEAEEPFDLARVPLIRARLLRLSDASHVLLVTLHHIVGDGWSIDLLISELGACYKAFAAGVTPSLPALEIQYADYAAWERATLTPDRIEDDLRFWRETLSGAPPLLELVTDRPRPAVMTYRGASERFEVAGPVLDGLRALADATGSSLFMALLAALDALLHRFSGMEEIVVGAPMANRAHPALEPLIGFFVNTLPLRVGIGDDPSFRQLLERARQATLGAVEHQGIPFERLVQELIPERDMSHTPFYQVVLALRNASSGTLGLEGLEIAPMRIASRTAKYDLTFVVEESRTGLAGLLEYNRDLFDGETTRRMVGLFTGLLAEVVRRPDARLSELDLLPPGDRERLDAWRVTRTAYPRERTIVELFDETAAHAPGAIALECGGRTQTYGELRAASDQLAVHLRHHGVERGGPVGICIDRSFEMIVSILAILKAGGAYVPLDPTHPDERLRVMIAEAGIGIIVTRTAERDRCASLTTGLSCRLLEIDRPSDHADGGASPPVRPEDPAYILFTSGSTGRPKGVVVPHRAVVRLVRGTDFIAYTAADVFLQLAPISFDASTLEIWGPLLNGGRLVIAPPGLLTPAEIGALVRDHGVTTLWLTASLFSLVVDECLEDLRSLKWLLAGGDVLSVPHVNRVLAELTCRFVNGYGPTENTTFTCCHEAERGREYAGSIPIGRPIANTSVFILDARRNRVPVGVPGELYTGGDGLAIGYVNRPELTAERFFEVSLDGESHRLYRTGDRARWLAGGAIEFLGRFDDQAKIRGFRVEPVEIEAALLRHENAREACVLVREDAPGRKEIVAYVVRRDVSRAGPGREDLARVLPDFMVPSHIVVLDALPITANGKLDRRALPAPGRSDAEQGFVPPRSETEAAVAAICAEVLGRERVGLRDDFFAIGGNSLLATQLVSRLRKRFSIDLPLRRIFSGSRVEQLAAAVEEEAGPVAASPAGPMPMIVRSRAESLPLSYAQERLWFLNRLEPDNPFYNVAVALAIRGDLDEAALEGSLAEIVRRHEILRTTYREEGGRTVQVIHPEGSFALERIDVRGAVDGEAEVRRLGAEEARGVFDLERGPLLRAKLLATGEAAWVLFLTMHHIAADGWSMGILVRELSFLYEAFRAGRPSPLAPLAVQYADFAAWQREWLAGERYREQWDYWKERLAGIPAELELPTDRPRPALQSYRGGSIRFEIDPGVRRRLDDLSRRLSATLFMTLQASFSVLLSRLSGQADIVIGTPIANRTRSEVEPLVGFFVNTLALRLDLGDDPSFVALVERARQAALDAYAHQDLPFERLVDELQPERDLSRNPVFQVMFALQNAPMRNLEMPGLDVATIEFGRTTAQFDLVLDMWETGGGLLGVLEYSTDLFDESTARRLVRHFETLLAAVADRPGLRASEIPVLDAAGERAMLAMGTGERAAFPVHRTLHELFEDEVAAGPGRIAAVHNGRRVTYAELDAEANRIAHLLRGAGIRRNDFVGILEPRGIGFLAALVGILKAGAAYVPIDPGYPEDRIAYMLENSGVPLVLTSEPAWTRLGCLAAKEAVRAVFLGSEEIARQPATTPDHVNLASDRAYMLYTSGSTGLPKGAIIRHDGKINHVYGQFRRMAFHRDSAFLQSAPASSDISVWQFIGPLLCGGRTVIADYETVCDAERLFELIRREAVTVIELVPVVMNALLDHAARLSPEERRLPALEWAMATGEAVSVALVNRWLSLFPDKRLVNAYGPTEAADDTCESIIEAPLSAAATTVTVGTAQPNLTMYVLDRNLRLVPPGVRGEIAVSGIGVGEGYWRDEEKTRAAFVPNPYAGEGRGDVLYRTGDIGYWRPDGLLECLSRMDDQVKIRGFRIELGEIEAVLGRHVAVRENAVVVREDEPGDRRLVAYVVPDREANRERIERIRAAQVKLWEELHEKSYQESLTYGDPTFNVIGWDSNYTNAPLPREEMREYVDGTTGRILGLAPRRVLEIGCGTGLIMFPLLPHLESYRGIDLSQVAIDRLKELRADEELGRRVPGLDRAVLEARRADDLADIPRGSVDTVILSSVVQYFPGPEYLVKVLEGAIAALSPGGSIFVGDVRSLPMLETFHASVQLYKSEESLATGELADRVRRQMEAEQEMAVDPAFFLALKRRTPAIRSVEILPKRGRGLNEMTRFRYDVILRLGEPTTESRPPWRDWSDEGRPSAEAIRDRLSKATDDVVALRGIANARVAPEERALRLMTSRERPSTVAALREEQGRAGVDGIEPEDLWRLADETPFEVRLSLASGAPDGAFDAVFVRRGLPFAPLMTDPPDAAVGWSHFANDPLREALGRDLVPEWKDFLRDKVPAYMVPSDFVLLGSLPQTPAGKVDRRRLPSPSRTRVARGDVFVEPAAGTEARLAAIWGEVLGVERVGARDNFFDLGGHSLKATLVVSRVNRDLGVELPLREIFGRPTVAELAARIDTMERAEYRGIARTPEAESYPLSHAQRRLWLLSRLEEGSVAYNMPAALLLEGPLRIDLLEQAYADTVARHESLRTTFVLEGEAARQKVRAPGEARIEVVDLSGGPDPEAEARERAARDAAAAFELETGPLIRVGLLRLAADRHVLLLTMHHIVSDDWSLGVLAREFLGRYRELVEGRAPSWKPLRIQYRDYAAWQTARLGAEETDGDRRYWRDRFGGTLPVLDLPADRPRPPVKTYNGAAISFRVGRDVADRLAALARARTATLFMTLLAGVKVLLHRYTGQEDIVVGTPVAGRTHADLEDQIGFFINMLALRDDVRAGESFARLLDRVRATTTEAYERQEYPFDRLVDDLDLKRDVSRMPLFDVVAVMQNAGRVEIAMPGVAVKTFFDDYPVSKYDLQFNFEEREDGLAASIVFNTDLFDRDRIERMRDHLLELLGGAARDPECAIGDLPILPEAERHRVLVDFNPRPGPLPTPPETLVAWFEEQAGRTPDRVAVSFQPVAESGEPVGARREMTYRELDEISNRLARHLARRGVAPGRRVGLFLERSPDLVVGLLGILKAGAAYVPMDPAYPPERLRFIMEDAEAPVIVTEEKLLDRLAGATAATVLMDRGAAFADEEATRPGIAVARADVAYVIYTSGSTGQPKGCLVTHGNVTRLFSATRHWFGFDESDVWTLFHSVAFDFSVWEIWGALLHGGRVVVVPFGISRSPAEFHRLLVAEGVTVLNQTPSAFRQLIPVATAAPDRPSLRTVVFGGEALDLENLRPWFDRFGDREPLLVNMYGITETTVHVTYRALGRADLDGKGSVIGVPIPDLTVRILDARRQPVPIGIAGEMYVAGAGVSNGYLNRPELTAEKFVALEEGGAAIHYRSGDLARYRPDGDIEYLGRIDHQVKIRGFRIELGEIESVLAAHADVREALIVPGTSPDGTRLVAYLVPAPGIRPEPTALRSFMKAKLPDYMVPAVFVPIESFPLTEHGKIDRRRLPDPDASRLESSGGAEEPCSDTERLVAEIFAGLLNAARVGRHENFFDIGAQSLLIVRAHATLKERLARTFPLIALYQHPTVSALASFLEGAAGTSGVTAEADERAAKARAARERRRRP